MKTCTLCKQEKALDEFTRDISRTDGRGSACRICHNLRQKIRRRALGPRPDQRAINLRAKYGITVEQFDAMLAAQAGRCACCNAAAPGGRWQQWHVDHDHSCCPGYRSCGRCVRALLCASCNLGLGHFNDDVSRLHAAITYLNNIKENTAP